MEMRKHVGHYISGLRGATTIRRQVNFATTLEQLTGLLAVSYTHLPVWDIAAPPRDKFPLLLNYHPLQLLSLIHI